MSQIKLIIFDLWDTLAHRTIGYHSVDKLLEVTESKIPKREFLKIFESSLQTRRWPSKYAAYENLCRNMGLPTTKENVERLMKIRDDAEATTTEFEFTNELLSKLKQKGYKLALLTNSSTFAIDQARARTRIFDYMDYEIITYDVGVIKPDKKIFLEALRQAGCKPEEAVMIGNTLADDIEPAKALGMRAILLTNYKELKKELGKLGVVV